MTRSLDYCKVPMTPDESVVWKSQEIDGGIMHTPFKDTIDDPETYFQEIIENPHRSKPLGPQTGSEGYVSEVNGLAIKRFYRPGYFTAKSHKDHMPSLQANVGLAEGLERLDQPDTNAFHYRGVKIHAAFESNNPSTTFDSFDARRKASHVMWLMEKVDPVPTFDYLKWCAYTRLPSKTSAGCLA